MIGGTNSRDPVTGEFIGGDLLSGEDGDDLLTGGFGNDSLAGGEGNDLITGSFGDNIVLAGGGNDTATGGIDEDTVYGESGDDLILGSGGNDEIYGDRDLAAAPDGNDNILAGSGNDFIAGGGGSDSIRGGLGNDIVDGGDGSGNFFRELDPGLEGLFDPTLGPFSGGDDEVFGREGDDTVIGGFGSDTVDGGGTLVGEFDLLYGGQLTYSLSNVIDEETGEEIPVIATQGVTSESLLGRDPVADTFVLGTEAGFKYTGGAGDLGITDRAVIIDFQSGVDSIQVTQPSVIAALPFDGDTLLALNLGNDNFEIIAQIVGITEFNPGDLTSNQLGTEGDDTLVGGLGADTLDGDAGNDLLRSRGGNDSLNGGLGRDRLIGGGFIAGEVDALTGGADEDVFVVGNANGFQYVSEPPGPPFLNFGENNRLVGINDRAEILDFENGIDKIQVAGPVTVLTLDLGSNGVPGGPSQFIVTSLGNLGTNFNHFDVVAQIVGFTDPLADGTFVS